VSEVQSNLSYDCKKCGAKGILVENVASINFNEVKKLPCGCQSDNDKFQFLHPPS
jgi:hypothetical protein